MTNQANDVFGISEEVIKFDLTKAKQTLQAKLDPSWIKQRQQGGTTLSYIGGHTVINLLNKAFNYQWSFEIVSEEVQESLPKPVWEGWGKNRKPKLDAQGNQVYEAQPPVAKIKGRLTVPGLGVKEQYGSKVIIGGATEQESSFKAASTDALKKCASLFGIGNELYGDEEFDFEEEVTTTPVQAVQTPAPAPAQPAQAPAPKQEPKPEVKQEVKQEKPAQPKTQGTPQAVQTASSTQVNPNEWNPADITRLKELKAIMGITDNTELNPYVQEWMKDKQATFYNIVASNIGQFNVWLAQKAEEI